MNLLSKYQYSSSGSVVDKSELKLIISGKSKDSWTLLDVREPDEFKAGSIPTSVNVPLSRFAEVIESDENARKQAFGVPMAKNDPLIVYCRSGKRSTMAQVAMQDAGFKNVRNYAGGFLDWSENE